MNRFWNAMLWIVMVVCVLTLLVIVLAYHDIGSVRFIGGYPGFPGAMNREQLKLYRDKRVQRQEYFPASDLYPNPSTAQKGV